MIIRETTQQKEWSDLVDELQAHPLQRWEWGHFKASTGPWTVHRLIIVSDGERVGGAQVLVRKMPFPLGAICYVPRGPFMRDPALLAHACNLVADWCRRNTDAVSVKIEPASTTLVLDDSWLPSARVLYPQTALIELGRPADKVIASIPNEATREYMIRSEEDGVRVRRATLQDVDTVLALYHEYANNIGATMREDNYYRTAFRELSGVSELLVAEYEGNMLAFLWTIFTAGTTFELWEGVTEEGLRMRANYLLKRCSIQAACERGSQVYDLNGTQTDGRMDFKLMLVEGPTSWVGSYDCPISLWYSIMNAAFNLRRIHKERAGSRHEATEE